MPANAHAGYGAVPCGAAVYPVPPVGGSGLVVSRVTRQAIHGCVPRGSRPLRFRALVLTQDRLRALRVLVDGRSVAVDRRAADDGTRTTIALRIRLRGRFLRRGTRHVIELRAIDASGRVRDSAVSFRTCRRGGARAKVAAATHAPRLDLDASAGSTLPVTITQDPRTKSCTASALLPLDLVDSRVGESCAAVVTTVMDDPFGDLSPPAYRDRASRPWLHGVLNDGHFDIAATIKPSRGPPPRGHGPSPLALTTGDVAALRAGVAATITAKTRSCTLSDGRTVTYHPALTTRHVVAFKAP